MSKPVDENQSNPIPATNPESACLPPVEELLSRLDCDLDMLRSLAELFFQEKPRILDEIRAAVSNRDASALERSAHRLKSSLSIFLASRATAAAGALEDAGRDRDLTRAEELLASLEKELRDLTPALTALVG